MQKLSGAKFQAAFTILHDKKSQKKRSHEEGANR